MTTVVMVVAGLIALVFILGSGTAQAQCCAVSAGGGGGGGRPSGKWPGAPPAPAAEVPTSTGILTVDQVAQLAASVGFADQDLIVAVAVAMAESKGDPNAYNPETKAGAPAGLGSYGLWQIFLKVHPEYKNVNLFDPNTNANAAFGVYTAAGESFEPWATFDPRDGSTPLYLAWMPKAQIAVSNLPNDSGVDLSAGG